MPGGFPETDGPAVRLAPVALTGTKTFENYIGGEWVDGVRRDVREHEPGHRRSDWCLPALERGGRRPRGRGGEGRVRGVALARPEAGRDPLPLCESPDRGEGRPHRPDVARDGEGEGGGGRRRAGGDRHEPLHGRRGTPPLRTDDAVGAARQVQHERAAANGIVGAITPGTSRSRSPRGRSRPPCRGNTVVFKPATDTPHSASASWSCSRKPVFRPVRAQHRARRRRRGRRPACQHPDVRVITLTGSRETGVEVMRNAAETLKHVHLELGGKNAIIVLDDADVELAVEGILWSAFGTSGQRCTAASRVIVQEGAYEQLQSSSSPLPRRCGSGPAGRTTPSGARDQQTRAREDRTVHRHRQGRRREA